MVLDGGTLVDLEVLSPLTTGGPTLLGLVDRTRSRLGRRILRRRLLAPAQTADEIVEIQQAHQALAADASTHRRHLDDADLDGVERYLGSNWRLPSTMAGPFPMAGRFWPGTWHRQYLQDVTGGQVRVRSLLAAASGIGARVSASGAVTLRRLGEQIGALIAAPEVRELWRLTTPRSPAARLAFDRLARETARPRLTEILESLGTIEAMWSLGVASAAYNWTYPRPGSRLEAKGLVHPFLRDAAVPNDLTLDTQVRICFVTGPNMAGKSTFLKAVAIAVLLAHAGCGVPAASLEFPVVGTVFSSVQIVDSVSAGESFYLAEVRRIRALAAALQACGPAIAIVDEPFRGTNVHDAADATLAIVTRLAALPGGMTFIASHLAEIVPSISGDARIAFVHFAADAADVEPRFDYRLRAGVSTQRLGMTLLRQEGVLELLDRAAQGVSAAGQKAPIVPGR
jgi:DNA mismatch repair protein MutS